MGPRTIVITSYLLLIIIITGLIVFAIRKIIKNKNYN